jgi:catechol 2,3-dioxygenase-like lactoylglutathione lyase family enzyme
MAKIRHIAFATDDPEKTAQFYKDVFEFKEVGRVNPGDNNLGWGVFLTDGTLNIAVLKFLTDQIGRGLDYTGLHHFGILVEDVDEKVNKIEAFGAEVFLKRPPDAQAAFFETKVRGPDGVVLDISDHPWIGNPEHSAPQAS